jgi:hypothetical protein
MISADYTLAIIRSLELSKIKFTGQRRGILVMIYKLPP